MTAFFSYGADILITLASLGAMAYCMILSRRLSRLTSFDKGLGGAIAVMSSQVDEMKIALRDAKAGTDGAGAQLNNLVQQARDISSELEMMIAACHDFAEEAITTQGKGAQQTGGSTPDHPLSEATIGADAAAQVEEDGRGGSLSEDITPMFGSRRAAAEQEARVKATVEPLFRRRESAG